LRRARLTLVALGALGCGRVTEPLVYDGHTLAPAKVFFAHIPENGRDETIAVISDRGDACTQFDGLGCVAQPHLGTTLVFHLKGFGRGTTTVGADFSARWLDFQGIRILEGEATAGQVMIDQADAQKKLGGEFDLTLPAGQIKNDFTADYCKPMWQYYVSCPESH
jgi:hypothetical protein